MAKPHPGYAVLDTTGREYAGSAELDDVLRAEADRTGGSVVSLLTGETVYQAERIFTVDSDGTATGGGLPEESTNKE